MHIPHKEQHMYAVNEERLKKQVEMEISEDTTLKYATEN